jgi:hypothetical protein
LGQCSQSIGANVFGIASPQVPQQLVSVTAHFQEYIDTYRNALNDCLPPASYDFLTYSNFAWHSTMKCTPVAAGDWASLMIVSGAVDF